MELTDSSGNYSIPVDTGSYSVRQIIPTELAENIQQVCPTDPPIHSIKVQFLQ
jgi:hypothetical protein